VKNRCLRAMSSIISERRLTSFTVRGGQPFDLAKQ
jgi:hypothetical protein